jgi:choline dehydrogenase-like flavoprotein
MATDFVVVGGGIGGAALAGLLGRGGKKVGQHCSPWQYPYGPKIRFNRMPSRSSAVQTR